MAPEPAKRKRARPPPHATESDASQTHENNDNEADAEDEPRPRKRGRPAKALDSAPVASPANRRKRGRPSLEAAQLAPTQEEEARPKPGRGRKAAAFVGEEQPEEQFEDTEDATQKRPRRRGRPSSQANHDTEEQREDGDGDEEEETRNEAHPNRRKRGRPSSKPTKNTEEEATTEHQEEPERNPRSRKGEEVPRRKRGRPSPNPQDEITDQPQAQKRKRGRPSLQDLPPEAQNSVSQKRPRASKEGGPAAKSTRRSEGAEAEQPSTRRRRSSQSTRADDAEPLPPSPAKPYAHVAPRVRRIRQSIIQDKWSPLAGSSLAVATDMLQLGQQPILQRLAGTQQRRGHASAALHLVAQRILRKMRKGLPFPPAAMTAVTSSSRGDADGGREAELDFERVLDARRALERRLDPALHAVELLRREKARMERELERDYDELKDLEVSARGNAREHRGLLKKAHVLAPGAASRQKQRGQIKFKHEDGEQAPSNLFTDIEDPELQGLALQLGGHAESIHTNMQQAAGIAPQMSRSRAMLQDVLLRHLTAAQYEQVLLG